MKAELAAYFRGEGPAPALERAALYRRLVHDNLGAVIDNAFPVTRAILGERFGPEVFEPFLSAGGPATPYYREVPGELVAWAQAASHPWADLLHYEWLELVAARHPADVDAPVAPDGSIRPNPTLQLGVYGRPVHLLSAARPEVPPFPAPSAYLVWRRPRTDQVVFHRVGLVVARALELAAAEPLGLEALAVRVAAEARLDPSVIRASLASTFDELRVLDGIC